MYTSAMYQQPMMIQMTDEQLRQHCPMKERSDNAGHCLKNEMHQHLFVNGGQHYYMYNNKHNNKKQNHWMHTNGYSNSRLLGQLQETLCPPRPSSHDSQTDSSSEDLNDLSCKGVKRLHELNGSHAQMVHSYTLHTHGYNTHGYQPNHKRRHHMTLPNIRRNKHLGNGANNYDSVPDRYLNRSESMQVKVTPKELVSGGEWDQLSTEIWRKFIKNQQTSESYINKIKLFKQLYINIKKVLRYSVFVVGSTFNGFGSNSSDLDLCLVIRSHVYIDPRMGALLHLENVKSLILNINQKEPDFCPFQKVEMIDAKVPLLKFRHCSGVDVDINCNNPVGIHNTHLLNCYSKADWRVQPLVLLVKLWAQAHQINDAKNSTISSYSLALMVIHFLQCGVQPAVLPCLHKVFPDKFRDDQEIHEINIQERLALPPSQNTQSLGQLLLQFFQYYCNFEFGDKAISVRTGTILPKVLCQRYQSPKNEPRAWSWLNIEEPFDHTNTARAVYNEEKFRYIVEVFKASCKALEETHTLDSIFHVSVPTSTTT